MRCGGGSKWEVEAEGLFAGTVGGGAVSGVGMGGVRTASGVAMSGVRGAAPDACENGQNAERVQSGLGHASD